MTLIHVTSVFNPNSIPITKGLIILLIQLLVFSCSQPTQTEKDLRATINKEVSLEIFDLVRRENTFLTLEELAAWIIQRAIQTMQSHVQLLNMKHINTVLKPIFHGKESGELFVNGITVKEKNIKERKISAYIQAEVADVPILLVGKIDKFKLQRVIFLSAIY